MMPGGFGTLDEYFEMVTWNQLGFTNKICGILNSHNYYDLLINFIRHGVAEKLIKAELMNKVIVEQEPEKMIQSLLEFSISE